MLETKKLNKGLVIVNVILIIAFFVVHIWVLVTQVQAPATQIGSLISIFALVAAFNYLVGKYEKSSAIYYKAYLALHVLVRLITLISVGMLSDNPGLLVINALEFCLAVILLVGKDLGKKVSMILCFVLIALCLVDVPVAFAARPENAVVLRVLGNGLSSLLCAILLTVMTYGKYLDKATRGTK